MKIRPKSEALNDSELIRKQQQSQKAAVSDLANQGQSKLQTEDTVKVGLSRAIAQLSTPRTEKIAELKALYESGKYQVDSRKIADVVKNTLDEEIQLERLLGV